MVGPRARGAPRPGLGRSPFPLLPLSQRCSLFWGPAGSKDGGLCPARLCQRPHQHPLHPTQASVGPTPCCLRECSILTPGPRWYWEGLAWGAQGPLLPWALSSHLSSGQVAPAGRDRAGGRVWGCRGPSVEKRSLRPGCPGPWGSGGGAGPWSRGPRFDGPRDTP